MIFKNKYELAFEKDFDKLVNGWLEMSVSPNCDCHKKGMILCGGTTIIAFKYNKGVIIGGDKRVSIGRDGYFINLTDEFNKIFKIGEDALVGISGSVGIALEMVKYINMEIEYFEKSEEQKLTIEGKVQLISRFLQKLMPMAMHGLTVMPIVANKEKCFLLFIDGAIMEMPLVYAGSGSQKCDAYLKAHYKSDIDKREAIKLIKEAFELAKIGDFATGGNSAIFTIEDKIDEGG